MDKGTKKTEKFAFVACSHILRQPHNQEVNIRVEANSLAVLYGRSPSAVSAKFHSAVPGHTRFKTRRSYI